LGGFYFGMFFIIITLMPYRLQCVTNTTA
jgi:hypothetical protein